MEPHRVDLPHLATLLVLHCLIVTSQDERYLVLRNTAKVSVIVLLQTWLSSVLFLNCVV